jgi:hypothetical protein
MGRVRAFAHACPILRVVSRSCATAEIRISRYKFESCYGKHAYREDVPRHLYHFSKETLRLYAEKFGLKLRKCSLTIAFGTVGGVLSDSSWAD